jgi:hypothetical protein
MKIKRTPRGFAISNFTDRSGVSCSLQESSLATEAAIWFGCNSPNPQVLVPGEGWKPYELPPDCVTNTRMHLTQDMVRKLLPFLKRFAKTGELE